MSEWGIALIAAGSAIAGSAVTGWFTRSTAQVTMDDQRKARVLDKRREVYARFVESAHVIEIAGSRDPKDLTELAHAIAMVQLEGPRRVALAATAYFGAVTRVLNDEADGDLLASLRRGFLEAAGNELQK